MPARLFVTGTGTGVGKTVVGRAIVSAFVRRGLEVAALKPVETGAVRRGGRLVPEDALALMAASGRDLPLDLVCAYCFEDPVSPHIAAARAGTRIEAESILGLIERRSAGADLILAEGAGGLLVPLNEEIVYGDLVAQSGFPLLVVVADVLGAINATLLTIEAARNRGIRIAGVIMNRAPAPLLGNAAAIRSFGQVEILGRFPEAAGLDDTALAGIAEQALDLDRLLSLAMG